MEKTLELLDTTVSDCDFVATCHYVEAEGDKNQRIRYGVPSLVINIVVGSVLVADLGKIVPDAMKWIGALLALASSFLVGIQTFYGFEKAERGHRQLGNKFNRISRALACLKAAYVDKTLDVAEFAKRFELVMKEYEEVCKENEDTPPSRETALKLKKKFEADKKAGAENKA
ncbi:MAG: SLATT domain-containing protein [Nitrospira sp.]|nr:SLATT domain-containing protein [Nitrospira sp.]